MVSSPWPSRLPITPRSYSRNAAMHDRAFIGQIMHGQDTSELFFESVKVPVENLLGGAEGQGMHQLMHDLPYERTVDRRRRGGRDGRRHRRNAEIRARAQDLRPAGVRTTRTRASSWPSSASIARIARVFIRSLRRWISSPASSTPRPRRWPSGGAPTCSSRCSTSACSCTAATAT